VLDCAIANVVFFTVRLSVTLLDPAYMIQDIETHFAPHDKAMFLGS